MVQIFLNYLVIFILPLFLGGLFRFVCRKFAKAWLITVLAAILSLTAWLVALHPPVLGSELYWLKAIQNVCFTAGSFLTGWLVRKRK